MSDSDQLFARNLSLLQQRFPELARRVASEPDDLEVRLAPCKAVNPRTGAPYQSLEVRDPHGGGFLRMHSAHDPVVEAQRRVGAMKLDEMPSWLICGFGLGYHVIEAKRRLLDKAFTMLVVEHSMSIFRAAMCAQDFHELLVAVNPLKGQEEIDTRVHLFVGANLQKMSEWVFYTLGETVITQITVHKHAPSERLFGPFYNQCVSETGNAVNRYEVNILTAQEYGRQFMSNMLQNGVTALESGNPGNVKGVFAGKPVFCVAAGPSLDRNAHLLRHAKGHGVIIAVDSAYETLLKVGVEPDVLAVIDPIARKAPILAKVNRPDETFLLAIQHCHPDLVDAFAGRRFVSFSNAPVAAWLERYTGEYSFLGECLTVAHGAFFFACFLGGDPVVFVGQDLAFPPDLSRTHAQSGEGWGAAFHLAHSRAETIPVPSVFGHPVPTFRNMAAFIKTFETEIDKRGVRCIDATEGGARITGTRIATLSEVIDEFCQDEPFAVTTLLAAGAKSRVTTDQVDRLAADAAAWKRRCDDMIATCGRGLRAAEEIQKIVDDPKFDQRMNSDREFFKRYHRVANKLIECNAKAFEDEKFTEVVSQSSVRTKLEVKRHDDAIKYAQNDAERQRRQAKKFIGAFTDFRRAAEFFKDELGRFLTRLEPVHERFRRRDGQGAP